MRTVPNSQGSKQIVNKTLFKSLMRNGHIKTSFSPGSENGNQKHVKVSRQQRAAEAKMLLLREDLILFAFCI